MRALIFGGTGMLGSAVAHEARQRRCAALALSHGQADVADRERLLYWAKAFRPEVVINCAAFTQVDDCETQEERALAVNGEAVANVAHAARAAGAPLLHVSTDYVFSGDAREPYREDAPTGPRSAYGRSKLRGEEHALSYDRSLVVRTSWLFGPGGVSFVATIVRLLEEGKLPLRVVDDQTGCPTYTRFLARALLDLAPLAASGELAGVLHYRNREPVTWYRFAREIARLWNRTQDVVPVGTEEFPRPAPRPAYSALDVSRFEEAAGREVEHWGWGLVEHLASMRPRRH